MVIPMEHNKFYLLGKIIYRFRWAIIALWFCLILSCLPFISSLITPFKTTGFVDEHATSTLAQNYLNKKLGYNNNRFIILYSSKSLVASDPLFIKKIKHSLEDLKNFPLKHLVVYPDQNKKQISKDKHTAYAVVMLKQSEAIDNKLLVLLESSIHKPKNMRMQIGGEPIFLQSVNKQTQVDLFKADLIATPVAIITLLFVFGSFVAAILPIILGGGCALIILTTLYFIGHVTTLSIFTLNIALLLGLCLSLDYSLFVISRFREELRKEQSISDVIAITQETAGKAILYSGLAVFASLSALFLFPINILFSVAVGGLSAVVMAVLTATIFLPAILSVLTIKINWLEIKLCRSINKKPSNLWHWIAEKVVKSPRFFFTVTLIFLLVLGYPFLSAQFGISNFRIFPEHSVHRQFFDTYSKTFNESELTPIILVVKSHDSILSAKHIDSLYDVTHKLTRNSSISQVNSIVSTDPNLSKQVYFNMYHLPKKQQNGSIKNLLTTTTGKHVTTIDITSKYASNSPNTAKLIDDLTTLTKHPKAGLTTVLTGLPVQNADVLKQIFHTLPYAIAWIMLFTYLILLLLLRSVFLPLKAILMNLLSLSACYGALVLVFQMGYLHTFLNFEPQGMLDVSLLVIIFCAVFGFSMDYEVFLLTRIKESYDATHDNEKSIIFGIEKSSRIISSAAIIVICLCGSFLVADVLMVKAFGLGIAMAIFVDAFLIRTILVPSTMTLVKQWNWYLPKWLEKILPKC